METFDGDIGRVNTRIVDSPFHMRDEQQIAVLHTLERVKQQFEQPLPHNSLKEAVAACHHVDPRFAQHAYQNLVDLLRTAETPHALEEFYSHGRAAVFEAVVGYLLPYMLEEEGMVLPSAETQRLWITLYNNKNTEVQDESGFRYREKHSPDVVVFRPDEDGNMGITTLIEATVNPGIQASDIRGKAKHSAFAMMRSQKRGLELFGSDTDVTMIMVIPNDLAVIHNIDRVLEDVWGKQEYSRRGREVTVRVAEDMMVDGKKTTPEILVHIHRLIVPLDSNAIYQIYTDLIQHYRPEGNEKYPTIEELLLGVPYGVLDTIELPETVSA